MDFLENVKRIRRLMVIPALKQMKITTEKTAGLIIKDIRPSTRDYIGEGKKKSRAVKTPMQEIVQIHN